MTAIVQWLWQGTLLAVALAAVLRYLPRVNAATRYVLWWLALAVVFALPLIDAWVLPALADRFGAVFAATASRATTLSAPSESMVDGAVQLAVNGLTSTTALFTAPALPDWFVAAVAGAWLGSVVLGLGRLAASLVAIGQLKRKARPLSLPVVQSLRLSRKARWRARRARLCSSPAISGACALGLSARPVVVVAERLLRGLSPEALDLIVLHEQLHLRRYDDWARLSQSMIHAVFRWHPGVRLIGHHLDREREAACDTAVVERSGDPRRYAACLADAADLMAGQPALFAPLVVPNAAGSGALLDRVQRLLDPRVPHRASLQLPVIGSIGGAMLSVATLVVAAGPVVVVPTAFSPAPSSAAVEPTAGVTAVAEMASVLAEGNNSRMIQIAGALTDVSRPVTMTADVEPRRKVREDIGATQPAEPTGVLPAAEQPAREDSDSDLTITALLPSRDLPAIGAAWPDSVERDALAGDASADKGMVTFATRFAEIGSTTGSTTRRAGVAIGGFFSRAGKAVAELRP